MNENKWRWNNYRNCDMFLIKMYLEYYLFIKYIEREKRKFQMLINGFWGLINNCLKTFKYIKENLRNNTFKTWDLKKYILIYF